MWCRSNTGRRPLSVDAIAARRAERNLAAETAESDLGAGVPHTGDSGHARAVRGRSDRPALVARRDDDEHAARDHLGDRIPPGCGAIPCAAQAHVDDFCGVRVVRHTADVNARRPQHRRNDVRVVAPAFAEDAHRQDPPLPRDARNRRSRCWSLRRRCRTPGCRARSCRTPWHQSPGSEASASRPPPSFATTGSVMKS